VDTPSGQQGPTLDDGRVWATSQITQMLLGDRAETHGPPHETFELIAYFWNPVFARYEQITPDVVCLMMVLLKVARALAGDPKHMDHALDAGGYSALWAAWLREEGAHE